MTVLYPVCNRPISGYDAELFEMASGILGGCFRGYIQVTMQPWTGDFLGRETLFRELLRQNRRPGRLERDGFVEFSVKFSPNGTARKEFVVSGPLALRQCSKPYVSIHFFSSKSCLIVILMQTHRNSHWTH